MIKQILSLIALLWLAACNAATSQTPNVTPAELAREQAEQERIIKEESGKVKVNSVAVTPTMISRLRRVAQPVHAAGRMVCQELGARACNLPFEIDKKNPEAVNAYTDGKRIVVTPAMMNFAQTDDQLATVLAHEYAHAVMEHPGKTGQNAAMGGLLGMAVDALASSQGFNTGGAFSKLGTQGAVLKYSQGFEKEADYIGMYILKRSGFNIHKAAGLWRRMAALNPNGIYVGTTHPTTAERYILLEKSAAEIEAKQKAGQKLLPGFKPKE